MVERSEFCDEAKRRLRSFLARRRDGVEKMRANTGTYRYKNFINYDSSICQYHERREEVCGKCAEVCPTVAILKEDETKHLVFSHIDCHGCGGCISVCPSGALDYTQMPRRAFSYMSEYYEGTIPLIIPQKMDLDSITIPLEENVLPMMIEGEKYLHEAHMLNLLQTCGNPIVFYTDFISKGTGDVIRIINEIFERKYAKSNFCLPKRTRVESRFRDDASFSGMSIRH